MMLLCSNRSRISSVYHWKAQCLVQKKVVCDFLKTAIFLQKGTGKLEWWNWRIFSGTWVDKQKRYAIFRRQKRAQKVTC